MRSTQIRALDRGAGAESLEIRTTDVGEPPRGQARIRVTAAGGSYGDLLFQRGVVPDGPKHPYVPGCDVTGTIESVGESVTGWEPGDRVTALVRSGGYADALNVPVERLVRLPHGIGDVEVAATVLNHYIAHQMLHRVAHVRPGQRILVHGASGGVGLAFLRLAALIDDLQVWGTCSAHNFELVREHGAHPIDYRNENFVAAVKSSGGAVDAVFDPIGGTQFIRSYRVLRRGGHLVAYGQSDALRGGKRNLLIGAVGFLGGIAAPKLVPDGRETTFYHAWSLEDDQPNAYQEDMAELLSLLSTGTISCGSVTVRPMSEYGKVFRTLEEGGAGKIVLDPQS